MAVLASDEWRSMLSFRRRITSAVFRCVTDAALARNRRRTNEAKQASIRRVSIPTNDVIISKREQNSFRANFGYFVARQKTTQEKTREQERFFRRPNEEAIIIAMDE